jgi:hypothetical protein
MGIAEEGEDIKPENAQDYKEVYRSWVIQHILRT